MTFQSSGKNITKTLKKIKIVIYPPRKMLCPLDKTSLGSRGTG
jgi:hypothetical protein